jgi:hypothetical protein
VTVPSFGPTEVPNYNRLPLDIHYVRGETVETQRFNLLDKSIDIGAVNRLAGSMDGDNEAESYRAIISLVAKYMDDKDGTGHNWAPVAMAPKKGEEPPVKRFRGPDGKPHPWDEAGKFLAVEKGSSRRRWLHLMNEDDTAEVDRETLVKLLEYLMEIAGKDRTPA